ncbi:MAG: DNA-3-methyladenine glycosylase 2 family protein [Candidatus Velthaea sp.]|jgi:DNA-3-methyladenine glycosylase II
MDDSVRVWTVPVRPPYRLDLTATALRRLSTNVVDVFDGCVYRRMLGESMQPVLVEVSQSAPDALTLRVTGTTDIDIAVLTGRMLGADVDLSHFYAVAARFPWLDRIVTAARGVKPPRYPTLWEAIVNAVVFQQVSIHAAAAILRRLIERYEPLHVVDAVALAPFVQPRTVADADPLDLRAVGLSVNKVVALRTLARAVLDGALDAHALEPLETGELAARLVTFKGIGPWTAAVIALRGFGRLDTFPLNDSGVARSLKDLSGEPAIDVHTLLAALGPQRGMLYYHLLIGRLAARGEIAL